MRAPAAPVFDRSFRDTAGCPNLGHTFFSLTANVWLIDHSRGLSHCVSGSLGTSCATPNIVMALMSGTMRGRHKPTNRPAGTRSARARVY